MRTVQGARLVLEPQTAAHAPEMFAVLSDPAIYEHENEPPRSLEWLRERYTRLESRRSSDGRETWLNWVIRLSSGEAVGYVQATVRTDGDAALGYELASAHWGRGLAREAVEAMVGELAARYGVRHLWAVLKRTNARSRRLLDRLGFVVAADAERRRRDVDDDEWLMHRAVAEPAAS